jgi:hypothetical protein
MKPTTRLCHGFRHLSQRDAYCAFLNPNDIAALFERTNFGGAEKSDVGRRGLMCECVLKRASGYHDGHTITTICKDAGLLRQDGTPMAGAVRWAFDQLYHSGGGPTILERLQNNMLTVSGERGETK